MWYPVLVPQMVGGLLPVCPVTAKLSVQTPVVEAATVNPVNVWKSNRSWHTLESTLLMVKVQVPVEVGVYELGKFGFWMYVLFVLMVEAHTEVEIKQQTPNPEAQFPEEEPPLLVHSELVKHVP